MNDHSPSLRWLVATLAVYLRAHPYACDAAEGIRQWWFETEVSMDELKAALQWMQQQQLVEELKAADGHVRYRRLAPLDRFDRLIADMGLPPAPGA